MEKSSTPTPEWGRGAPDDTGYPWRSATGAARYYVHLRDRTGGAPSIDGARLISTARLNGNGDVIEWVNVPATATDGGTGSAREDRLCLMADLEACLPESPRLRTVLLVRTVVTQRRACELLREATGGEPWYAEKLDRVYGQALRVFASALRERGLLPKIV